MTGLLINIVLAYNFSINIRNRVLAVVVVDNIVAASGTASITDITVVSVVINFYEHQVYLMVKWLMALNDDAVIAATVVIVTNAATCHTARKRGQVKPSPHFDLGVSVREA